MRFFVCSELLEQVDFGINKIRKLRKLKYRDDMVLEALYIYAFSLFESTLTECIRHFLSAFPEKMGKVKEKVNLLPLYEHPLYSGYFMAELVNTEVKRLNKGNAKELLCSSLSIFDIAYDQFIKYFTELDVVSENRNKLVHENVKRPGNYIYSPRISEKRDEIITYELYVQHLEVLINVLSDFRMEFAKKYGKYTMRKLLRDLWNEIFTTPLLPFEKCFRSGESIELDISFLETVKNSLSSSEQYFLSLFLQNHNGELQQKWFRRLPGFVSITDKEKIFKILHLFMLYPHLLQSAIKYDDNL